MKNHRLLILMIASSLFVSACALTSQLIGRGKGVVDSLFQQDESIQNDELSSIEEETEPLSPQDDDEPFETSQFEDAVFPQGDHDQLSTSNNCYHPFFPISEGAYWTYQETAGEGYTLRMTEVKQDSFIQVQEMMNDDLVFTIEWYCSDSGILSGAFSMVDFFNQTDDDTPEMVLDTLGWDGETLPSPELMEPGYQWTSSYQFSAKMNIESFNQMYESNVTVDHEIAAIETVTVPAGIFNNAFRVDSRGTVEMTMNMGNSSVPFSSMDFIYSTWYVEGVGMVKSSDAFSGLTNDVELIDYSVN